MDRFPRATRWLLVTLVPLWLVSFGLHVFSTFETGAALPGFFASPVAGDTYPHIGGLRPEREVGHADVQLGDRLISARGIDLADVGYVGFYAWMVDQADDDLRVPLVVERAGQRHETLVTLSSTAIPSSRIALFLVCFVLSLLVLLRVPSEPMAQLFFASTTSFAIVEMPYTINREFALLHLAVFTYGGGFAISLLLRFFLLFPDDAQARRRPALGLCWVGVPCFLVPRLFYAFGGPFPTDLIPTLILVLDAFLGLCVLMAVAWNHAHAGPAGRRRTRGLLWAAAITGSTLPLALAAGQAFGLAWVRPTVDIVAFTSMLIPLSIALAVVRHDAFDVDKLVSATAAIGASLAFVLMTLLAIAPRAASWIADATGLGHGWSQLLVAGSAGVSLIPLTRSLRPFMDRWLHPSREALERGIDELLHELREHEDAHTLVGLAAARLERLLDPSHATLYLRGSGGFEPVDGTAPAKEDSAQAPLGSLAGPTTIEDPSLDPAQRACLEGLAASLALPFRRAGSTDAVLILGALRSGDIYTPTHLALLAAVADRVESQRERHEDAERILESGRRMEALEKQRVEVEEAFLARTRSLATASHDLRQPLHAMGLLVESLGRRPLDHEGRALLGQLGVATGTLAEMFDALLDLSRLEAGAIEPDRRAIALPALFERLDVALRPTAEAKGLTFVSSPLPVEIESDPVWLARILQNLLANAVRYTKTGQVTLRAERLPSEGKVQICVEDTGPGIPAEEQASIFQEFRRLPGAQASDERGLGLGLAIVDRLAALLEHDLDLSSSSSGTTFRLHVGMGTALADAMPTARAPDLLRGLEVWVVDDDPAIREGMRGVLEGWGCNVRLAASADDVLAWDEDAPDVAIVDVDLGRGATGPEVLAALEERGRGPGLALLITGESEPNRLAGLRQEGFALLTKPVAPARLRAVLQTARA